MQTELKNEDMLEPQSNPYTDSVAPLTNGILKIYEPGLLQVEKALKELKEKEAVLQDRVHTENLALAEIMYSDELNVIFNKIELYQAKLVNIKKDMKSLHDKSIKLKKRSLKIQQFREKQEYIKQQKEAEIKLEQDLIGKHVPKPT